MVSESPAAADLEAANPTAREAILAVVGGGGRGGVVAVVLRAAGRLQGTLQARIHSVGGCTMSICHSERLRETLRETSTLLVAEALRLRLYYAFGSSNILPTL